MRLHAVPCGYLPGTSNPTVAGSNPAGGAEKPQVSGDFEARVRGGRLPGCTGGRTIRGVSTSHDERQAVLWHLSDKFDPIVAPLADRHYNRRAIGSPQFVPPGRSLVLKAFTPEGDVGAFWI